MMMGLCFNFFKLVCKEIYIFEIIKGIPRSLFFFTDYQTSWCMVILRRVMSVVKLFQFFSLLRSFSDHTLKKTLWPSFMDGV